MPDRPSVVCAGIIVVDHVASEIPSLPGAGELTLTGDCQLHIGGCASNVAIDLARLDVSARIVGCVGDDVFGQFARESLQAEGVDPKRLVSCAGVSTSQTLVLNVRGEDRRFVHHIGANRQFSAAMLPIDEISQSKVLYVGGYFLLDRLLAGELAAVFKSARQAGVRTVLDVVTPDERDYETALRELLPFTDYFLPNEDEARRMCHLHRPIDQVRRFRQMGAAAVIITRGKDGCLYSSESEEFESAAFPVPFIDATGGGDAFDAGFINGLLRGLNPRECVRMGSALGASCVRASGATRGVFRTRELTAFLESNPTEVQ